MTSVDRVVESIVVPAPPAAVYALVSDPRNYARWSSEADGARIPGGLPLHEGDAFVGLNKLWVSWSGQCTVVAADGERFAFDVRIAGIPVARWGYTVEPVAGGSRVTETWEDRRSGILGALIRPSGIFVGRGTSAKDRNAETMRATLAALEAELAATET